VEAGALWFGGHVVVSNRGMIEPLSPAARIFGDRIKSVRVELGLSQEAVAELAQMHVTNFGKIERGTANPSFLTVLRIASVLGTDMASLTEGITQEHLPEELTIVPAIEFVRARDDARR
jgi:transcriptional regulator with XRE-family HTH domain